MSLKTSTQSEPKTAHLNHLPRHVQPTNEIERPGFEDKFYDQFVPELLASYSAIGGLNNRDAHNMPSTRAVGQICEDLLQLLFPGFHDDDAVHHGTLAELTHERVVKLGQRLEDQVRKSVRIGDPKKPTGRTPPILRLFFHSFAHVRELLRTDIEAAYEGDPAALYSEEIILSYPFIEAIAIQRLAHVLYVAGAPIIPRMMTEWAHSRTGIDIHPGARSFVKDESGHIVKGGKRHPDVGDHVTIYPNSTILGGKTHIGANSTIGANVFLMQSVPADSLVLYEEKQLAIHDKSARKKEAAHDWII